MTVAAVEANQCDTLPVNRARETVRLVRDILAGQGLSESLSADEEGFYFVAEDAAEMTIYYNAVEEHRISPRVRGRTREVGLLKCCRALARHGFTLTLFLSGRTSALFVRDE